MNNNMDLDILFDTDDEQDVEDMSLHKRSSSSDCMSYESDDDDSDGYDDIFDEPPSKPICQVDFIVKSLDQLGDMQTKAVEHISSLLATSFNESTALLHFFRWNQEVLIEEYMNDPEETLIKAGATAALSTSNSDSMVAAVSPRKRQKSIFECQICFDSQVRSEAVDSACLHLFCKTCYEGYIYSKVKDGESSGIRCPQPSCRFVLSQTIIKDLLDPTTFQEYKRSLCKAFVQDLPSLKWCAAPDCSYAFECHVPRTSFSSIVPTVTCQCGYSMCFGCEQGDHQPAPCILVKKWLKKCQDDSETSYWLSIHTKECSQCHATIEKNGGCNHMTCKKCRYEFCWVCMGSWLGHNSRMYNCNTYRKTDDGSISEKKAHLERYLHYYKRYSNHNSSAKLEEKLYKQQEYNMSKLQDSSDLTWIQVQCFKQAVDTVIKCRSTLKWTYVFAYYLETTHQTTLFEDNQRDLELATEQLSRLLEQPIHQDNKNEMRKKILDKAAYVTQREETLLQDTFIGLQEGRWKFSVDVD